jgi:hypothetical protein
MWKEIGEILRMILKPEFSHGVVILSAVVIGACAASLRLGGGAFGLHMVVWPRILVICIVGFGLTLVAVTAVRLYALDDTASRGLAIGLQVAALLFVLLAVVIPLTCFLLKGNYIECSMAVVASLIASLLITLLVRGCWQAISAGSSGMKDAKERREKMEKAVGGEL